MNPPYIPAKSFALAVLDEFRGENEFIDMNKIRMRLLEPTFEVKGNIRKVLLGLFERAEGDLGRFQTHIETFYTDSMERAAGVYKRSTQKIILVISILLTCMVKADTVHIARSMWENPQSANVKADKLAAAFTEIKEKAGDSIDLRGIRIEADRLVYEPPAIVTDTTATSPVPPARQTTAYLKNAGIPIGWQGSNIPDGSTADIVFGWIFKLFGLAITVTALMLGAPFWFDLLNKIVNLRSTGKKPDDNSRTSRAENRESNILTDNAVG